MISVYLKKKVNLQKVIFYEYNRLIDFVNFEDSNLDLKIEKPQMILT